MGARRISEDDFDRLLHTFARSAFRLETRDWYALSYEAVEFQRFLDGSPNPPSQVDWWRPWLEMIQGMTRQGKTISRVRILAESPTDYQRWELWTDPWHARAGERIRYMTRNMAREIALPDSEDWWLLDDQRVIIMGFSGTGEITGKLLVDDPETVAQHCEWRDLAVRNAISAEAITAA